MVHTLYFALYFVALAMLPVCTVNGLNSKPISEINSTEKQPDLEKDEMKIDQNVAVGKNNETYEKVDFIVSNNDVIALMQKRLDNDAIKKSLDDFTMVRKKTHVTIPNFDSFKPYVKHNPGVNRIPRANGKDPGTKVFRNEFDENTYNLNNKNTNYGGNNFKLHINEENLDTIIEPHVIIEPDMFDVMRKQTELMEKLIVNLENEGKALRKTGVDDFENLLKDMDEKYNRLNEDTPEDNEMNKRVKGATVKTTTEVMSTVMTLIDAEEVRKALRSDPYVRRILALASRKRGEYLNHALKLARSV